MALKEAAGRAEKDQALSQAAGTQSGLADERGRDDKVEDWQMRRERRLGPVFCKVSATVSDGDCSWRAKPAARRTETGVKGRKQPVKSTVLAVTVRRWRCDARGRRNAVCPLSAWLWSRSRDGSGCPIAATW